MHHYVYLAAATENLDTQDAMTHLATRIGKALDLPPGHTPPMHIVRACPPHTSVRRGFPEVREVLAFAPDAVLVTGMKGTPSARMLANLGAPVIAVDKLAKMRPPQEGGWTAPTLDAPGMIEQIRDQGKLTVLDRRLAPQEGDGVTLSLNPLGFAIPGVDWFMWRSRAINIPRPDDRGLAVVCPPEDYVVAGAHVTPMMLLPDVSALPAFQKCIVRSSVLWPSSKPLPEFVSGGKLYGTTETARLHGKVWGLPVSHILIGLRRAGVKEPVHFRSHEELVRELMSPQTAMELATLNQLYGPFTFSVDGQDSEDYSPLTIRIDGRDVEAGYLSSGIADWLGIWRGQDMPVLDATWIEGQGQAADFALSVGYQPGPAPSDTPEVMLTPVPLYPMM